METEATSLPGVRLIKPRVHGDSRGFFIETWHQERYAEAGIGGPFVQDNHSLSEAGILRGLHTQVERAQGKLVRCIEGTVFDVAVDIRRGSPTFLQWFGVELSAENHHQLWIPPGHAHGFCVLSKRAQVEYKCTDIYVPEDEITLAWNDPDIGIEWPLADPQLSDRDRSAPRVTELSDRLPVFA